MNLVIPQLFLDFVNARRKPAEGKVEMADKGIGKRTRFRHRQYPVMEMVPDQLHTQEFAEQQQRQTGGAFGSDSQRHRAFAVAAPRHRPLMKLRPGGHNLADAGAPAVVGRRPENHVAAVKAVLPRIFSRKKGAF